MTSKTNAPVWFWTIATLLVLWEVIGCFACVTQIKEGAAAMGPIDDWSLRYYAALPVWYNAVYAVATFGGLIGGLALLMRDKRARVAFWTSFVAVIVMFGYAFVATDLVRRVRRTPALGWALALRYSVQDTMSSVVVSARIYMTPS